MYATVCNLILNNGRACKVLGYFRTGSVKQYMPTLLPLVLLMLDLGHITSNHVSECFYGCPAYTLVGLEESRSPRILFFFFFGLCFLFLFYFLLYNIVLVLPYINMNPPQVPKILLTHSHLMPHESSTLALLGPSNTLRAVLECVFNWYKGGMALSRNPMGLHCDSPPELCQTLHTMSSPSTEH